MPIHAAGTPRERRARPMTPETTGLEGLIEAIKLTSRLLARRDESNMPSLITELISDHDAAGRIAFLRDWRDRGLCEFIDRYASDLQDSIYQLINDDGLAEAKIVALEALDELGFQVRALLEHEEAEPHAVLDNQAANPALAMAA